MPHKEKLWTPSFIAVTIANFIAALTYYLVAMKIVEYAYVTYEVSYSAAGAMITVYSVASVSTRFAFGGKMDAWGLRRSALLGGGLIVAASALYVVEMGFWPLLGVRVLYGVGFAINTGALAAIAALLVPKSRQGEGIGYFSLSTAFAMGIGPMLAMTLMNHGVEYVELFVMTLAMSVVALVSMLVVKVPEPSREQRANCMREKRRLSASAPLDERAASTGRNFIAIVGRYLHVGILPMASVVVPLMFCYSGLLSFMTAFADDRGLTEAASAYFLVYAISMLITRPMMGRRLDRLGENAVLYLTFVGAAAGFVALAFAFNAPMLLLSAVLVGFGTGATQSTVQAMVAKYSAQEDLGKANSTYFLCLDFGLGLGPMVIGAFLPAVGYLGVFLILAGVELAACLYYRAVHGHKECASRGFDR